MLPIVRKHGPLADTPMPMLAHSLVANDTGIYLVGGGSDTFLYMAVAADFSPQSLTWIALAKPPRARAYASAVCLDGKIYVAGGSNDDPHPDKRAIDSLDIYDIASNTWSVGASLPYAVYMAAAVVEGRTLHVVGGEACRDGKSVVSGHLQYNLDSGVWAGPIPIANFASTVGQASANVGGKLYFFGGSGFNRVFDPASETWGNLAPYPGRDSVGAACTGVGTAIVFYSCPYDGSVWYYDTINNAWSNSGLKLLLANWGLCAAVGLSRNNAVFAVVSGGVTLGSVPTAKVEFFGFQITPDALVSGTNASSEVLPVSEAATSSDVSKPPPLEAIYGEDNRIEVTDITDPTRRNLAQATCGLFASNRVKVGASGYEVAPASTFQVQLRARFPDTPISPTVKFLSQPTAAFGTGALIAPNLILTAAHNFYKTDGTVQRNPGDVWIAFGWTFAGGMELIAGKVFKGRRIVRFSYGDWGSSGKTDWAVVELGDASDPTCPATSIGIPMLGLVDVDPPARTPIWMAGHCSGLPAKYTDAKVVANISLSCETNLDSFAGNSGSAVLDASNSLVGVFMSGPTADFQVKNGQVVESEFNATFPANFCKTKPIFHLRKAATHRIRFVVGGDFWADSGDSLGFALDHEPVQKWTSPLLSWQRNSSYERPVENNGPEYFPASLNIKKYAETLFTDDLQLVAVELYADEMLVQRWLLNKWMGRGEVFSLSIEPKYTPSV